MTNDQVLEEVKLLITMDTDGLDKEAKELIDTYRDVFKKILKERDIATKAGNKTSLSENMKLLKQQRKDYNELLTYQLNGDKKRLRSYKDFVKAKELEHKRELERIKETAKAEQEAEAKAAKRNTASDGYGMGRKMKTIAGYKLAGAALAPLIAGLALLKDKFVEVVVDGAKLNEELSKLAAISRATPDQMKAMRDSMIEVTNSLGYTSLEVVTLQTSLSKLGVGAKNISTVTKSVAEFAKLSGSDLQKTGELVIQTMNAYGMSFEKVNYVVNQMNVTINQSTLTMEQYATVLQYVASAAEETGVSFEKSNAMISLLANNGIKASTAGTSLRNIFGELTKSGDSLDTAIRKLKDSNMSYADAVDLVGKRAANSLSIIVAKYDEVAKAQNEALASIVTVSAQLENAMQSPVTKIKNAANSITESLKQITDGAINAADALLLMGTESDKIKLATGILDNYIKSKIPKGFENMTMEQREKWFNDTIAAFRSIAGNEEIYTRASGGRNAKDYAAGGMFGTATQVNKIDNTDKFVANWMDQQATGIISSITESLNGKFSDALRDEQFAKAYTSGGAEEQDKAMRDWVDAELSRELRAKGLTVSRKPGVNGTSEYDNLMQSILNSFSGRSQGLETWKYEIQKFEEEIASLRKEADSGKGTTMGANRIAELQEKIKHNKEQICLFFPTSPFCKDVKTGSKDKDPLSTYDDLYSMIVNELTDELKKYKDAAKVLADDKLLATENITSEFGTAEYDAEMRSIEEVYSKGFNELDDLYFNPENGLIPKMINKMEVKSVDVIGKLKARHAEIAGQIAKRYQDVNSTEYKNAIAKNDRKLEELTLKAERLAIGNESLAGTTRRSEKGTARANISKFGGFISDPNSNAASVADLISQAANVLGLSDIDASGLQAQITELENKRENTANPFKRNAINKEIEALRKQSLEMMKSAAKSSVEKYKEAKALNDAEIDRLRNRESEINSQADSFLLEVDLMKEGDVDLARFGGAKSKSEARTIIEKARATGIRSNNGYLKTAINTGKSLNDGIAKGEAMQNEGFKEKNTLMEILRKNKEAMLEYTDFGFDLYQQYQNRMLQATLDRIDAEIQAEKDKLDRTQSMNSGALELGLISQSEYARKNIEAEKEFEKQKDKLQKEAFEAEKKAEAKQAMIKGTQRVAEIALNILTAESKKGLFGLGTAAAAQAAFIPLAVAQTAAEVAAINKKEYVPTKFSKGGLITGESHANGGVPFTVNGASGFEAEGGEFIVNKSSTSRYMTELQQMNNGSFDKNSYYSNTGALVERLDILIKQNSKPVRSFVSEADLRRDEVARRTKTNRATV